MRTSLRFLLALCALLAYGQFNLAMPQEGNELQLAPGLRISPEAPIPGSEGYPRIVRVMNESEHYTGELIASSRSDLFSSNDHGKTWTRISTVDASSNGLTFRCCETLFQLERQVGSLPRGTLIYAAAYLKGSTPAIAYFTSSDHGRAWQYQGIPVARGDLHHGLWEPQFEIADDGALVMFWSDETDPAHSQKLVQMRNYFKGAGWEDQRDTVASGVKQDRPGMAVVSRVSNGRFFMTYEVQGPRFSGTVHARVSTDGWNFGDPSDLGFVPKDEKGDYFKVAPNNTWLPGSGQESGRIIVVGRNLIDSNGKQAPLDGQVLFANADPEGHGTWSSLPAPVKVSGIPPSTNINCANYSSALLAYPNGLGLVELATKPDNPGVKFGKGCTVYVGHLAISR